MQRGRRQARGVFIVEALCGLVLIGVTLFAVSMLVTSYQRVQQYMIAHRQVQLAAEGAMEQYRSGQPLPDDGADVDGPPGIKLHVEQQPGEDEWEGFQYVRVTATTTAAHGKQVTYRVSAYVAAQRSVSAGDAAGGAATGEATP